MGRPLQWGYGGVAGVNAKSRRRTRLGASPSSATGGSAVSVVFESSHPRRSVARLTVAGGCPGTTGVVFSMPPSATESGAQKDRGVGDGRSMPEGVTGTDCLRPHVSAKRYGLHRWRRCYFFFGLALLLLAAFGLAAALVFLPDPHPQRLHAILAPFKRRSVSLGLSFPLLSAVRQETL